MKKMMLALLTGLALACPAGHVFGQAGYIQGYGFGLGANFGGFGPGFGGFAGSSFQEPPYFARHPPVYYSHIVPRPYGISPYAAPPGIVPTEMRVQVKREPLTVVNPYYDSAPSSLNSAPAGMPSVDGQLPAVDSVPMIPLNVAPPATDVIEAQAPAAAESTPPASVEKEQAAQATAGEAQSADKAAVVEEAPEKPAKPKKRPRKKS